MTPDAGVLDPAKPHTTAAAAEPGGRVPLDT